ncbi:glycerophosphodiester phosphodiesterase [Leifsonia sp. RAF41]|uniref:glycerophosphodiester phosphodiesterase n=1 Tax=Leifsonia sp. RAF41 TaxID=3233056 RepID=UPI003F9D00A4
MNPRWESPRSSSSRSLSRRDLLVFGGSALLLAGCSTVSTGPARPTAGATFTATPYAGTRYTIESLVSTTPFFIAHRGSGDNWPEHTMQAYSEAIGIGTKAIEVSVNATKDGVLVCHHDTDMARTSGANIKIAEATWAQLKQLTIDAGRWLGPASQPQPIPLVKDVLDAYAGTHVIFIEDKQGTNTKALLDLMDSYADSTKHFVWKQWVGAGQVKAARERGYRTWGYFSPELIPRAAELAPSFDYLGAMHTFTDDEISAVVAAGKPVIVWEVHYRSDVDRFRALGVVGMMASNYPYVTRSLKPAATDAFASGLRATGDLPWTVDEGWPAQPVIDKRSASIALADSRSQSYLMGSMATAPRTAAFSTRLRWPRDIGPAQSGAGLAFGLSDDHSYRLGVASETSGYHALLHPDGKLELVKRRAGEADGESLNAVATTPPTAGEWVTITVKADAEGLSVTRSGHAGWTVTSKDTEFRGGYFWLCKGAGAGTVEYGRVRAA